jgi:hypothetical protein
VRFPGWNDHDHDEDHYRDHDEDHDHSDYGCDDSARADRADCDGVAEISSKLFVHSVVVSNHGI